MKILYIHQHFTTPAGAGGVRSYRFAQALLQAGHSVTMLCGSHDVSKTGLSGPFRSGIRRGVVDGIDVIEVNIPYSNRDGFVVRTGKFLKFAWRCVRIACRESYDLIFATSTPLTVAIPAIIGKLIRRKPYVIEVRDLWPELPRAMGVITNPVILWMMGALEYVAYRYADGHIGLSPGIVSGIERRLPAGRRVHMIPNGCDIDYFDIASSQRSYPIGFDAGDFIAIFSGAHGLANGLDAVLDVAGVLKSRGEDRIKFLLVGDGKLKSALQARARAEGLDNCIFWDLMSKDDLRLVFQQVDVGLMVLANISAFYYGTSPNKFFDYLSAGLPVLNNYPGWVADLVTERACGEAVSPADPGAFADALVRLRDMSSDARVALGERARNLARESFDRSQLAQRFVAVLESVGQPDTLTEGTFATAGEVIDKARS